MFAAMHRLRGVLVHWCQSKETAGGQRHLVKVLEAAQSFTFREQYFATALKQLQIDSTLWRNTSNDMYLTEHTVESEHPIPYDVYSIEKVEIVNASYLIISFDEMTNLGNRQGAVLKIFADEEQTEVLGEFKSGSKVSWPGAGGNTPIISKGSSVFILLMSDGPPPNGQMESEEAEWGYKVHAQASIPETLVEELMEDLQGEMRKQGFKGEVLKRYTFDKCRNALRVCKNDKKSAKFYLKSNNEDRVRNHSEDNSGKISGN
jgi:hypothetical protein